MREPRAGEPKLDDAAFMPATPPSVSADVGASSSFDGRGRSPAPFRGGTWAPAFPVRAGTPTGAGRAGSVAAAARGPAASGGGEGSVMTMVRRQMDALEEKLGGQMARLQKQSESIRDMAFSRIDSKMGTLEAGQPKIDRRLSELSGKFTGLSDGLNAQIKRVDQMDARLWEFRRQQEETVRAKHCEMDSSHQKLNSAHRVATTNNEEMHKRTSQKMKRLEAMVEERLQGNDETGQGIMELHQRLESLEEHHHAGLEAQDTPRVERSPRPDNQEDQRVGDHDVSLQLLESRFAEMAQKVEHLIQEYPEVHTKVESQEERLKTLRTLIEPMHEHHRKFGNRIEQTDVDAKLKDVHKKVEEAQMAHLPHKENLEVLQNRFQQFEMVQEELADQMRRLQARFVPGDFDAAPSEDHLAQHLGFQQNGSPSRGGASDAQGGRNLGGGGDAAAGGVSAALLAEVKSQLDSVSTEIEVMKCDNEFLPQVQMLVKQLTEFAPKVMEHDKILSKLTGDAIASSRVQRLETEVDRLGHEIDRMALSFEFSFAQTLPGGGSAAPYEREPTKNVAFLLPGDEELFLGGGGGEPSDWNGAVGKLLLEQASQPIAFERDGDGQYVMEKDPVTSKNKAKFNKSQCFFRKTHEALFARSRAQRRELVVSSHADLEKYNASSLAFAAARTYSDGDRPFGSAFLDIFKREHRPFSSKNVALLYVVGPLGRSVSNQASGGAGIGEASRARYVKTDAQDFLFETYKSGANGLQLVLDCNAGTGARQAGEPPPPIEVLRVPIVSGGLSIHPEVTPKEVALALLWGLHSALAGVDRQSRVEIELMPGKDMQEAYDLYRAGARPSDWNSPARKKIFEKIPRLLKVPRLGFPTLVGDDELHQHEEEHKSERPQEFRMWFTANADSRRAFEQVHHQMESLLDNLPGDGVHKAAFTVEVPRVDQYFCAGPKCGPKAATRHGKVDMEVKNLKNVSPHGSESWEKATGVDLSQYTKLPWVALQKTRSRCKTKQAVHGTRLEGLKALEVTEIRVVEPSIYEAATGGRQRLRCEAYLTLAVEGLPSVIEQVFGELRLREVASLALPNTGSGCENGVYGCNVSYPRFISIEATSSEMPVERPSTGPIKPDQKQSWQSSGNPFASGNPFEIRSKRRDDANKLARGLGASRSVPRTLDHSSADSSKWVFDETVYGGAYSYQQKPEFDKIEGLISEGTEKLKTNTELYEGIFYQTSMTDWPEDQQSYTLVKRTGSGFRVKPDPHGGFTYFASKFQALDPNVDIQPDAFTDSMSYGGQRLGSTLVGRGQGVCDIPGLKVIGNVDPSDVSQGKVGDCWLLSAISALAEYDGAIAKLFRNTRNLCNMPRDGFNQYTLTLYDLTTWQPVDVVVDERLCTIKDHTLMGAEPSVDGELWVCYLEKAIAAHCGGWDKINGGTCCHGWRLLLGCKDQYTFRHDGQGFKCMGARNANTGEWERLANSPHEGFQGLWGMDWPEVGGGGVSSQRLAANEMFERMCAWDDASFLMGAGTKSGSDSESTDGIVDGHAYTILQCINDANGTDSGFDCDMIKVRNPWGRGEFQSGLFDDDGPGWAKYPAVKERCKPVKADDGVFWVTKEEFFEYFTSIYLSAHDMSEFLQD